MNTRETHPSFRQLVQILEDPVGSRRWSRHLSRCARCADRLEGLRAQARAVQLLARSQGVTPRRGSVLGAARDAGWQCLRRLARELVCACARLDPELAPRARRLQLARPVPRVAADLQAMARRLTGLGLVVDLEGLPERTPRTGQARDAVRRALAVLARWQTDDEREELERMLSGGGVDTSRAPSPSRACYQPTANPSLRDSLAPR